MTDNPVNAWHAGGGGWGMALIRLIWLAPLVLMALVCGKEKR